MLGQRRRRRATIEPTLGQCHMLSAGHMKLAAFISRANGVGGRRIYFN